MDCVCVCLVGKAGGRWRTTSQGSTLLALVVLVDDEATALLSRVAPGVSVDVIELVSRACAYDPYPVAVLGARWHDVASQGFQC